MIKITQPIEIEPDNLFQIIELVINGGQVRREGLRERIMRSDLVAYKLHGNIVICTATIKNPHANYTRKVFTSAKVLSSNKYRKELGYISTHNDFEGLGNCQDLLKTFFNSIGHFPMYATTRKPSMVHILRKFGFNVIGITYNQDLILMTNDFKG